MLQFGKVVGKTTVVPSYCFFEWGGDYWILRLNYSTIVDRLLFLREINQSWKSDKYDSILSCSNDDDEYIFSLFKITKLYNNILEGDFWKWNGQIYGAIYSPVTIYFRKQFYRRRILSNQIYRDITLVTHIRSFRYEKWL